MYGLRLPRLFTACGSSPGRPLRAGGKATNGPKTLLGRVGLRVTNSFVMTLYRLYLTADERQTLVGWQKKYKAHSAKLRDIQILLNSDEQTGRRPALELAAVLGICTRTVERVRRQFCEKGLKMFEPKVRKMRSDNKIDGRVEAHLTVLLCQPPPR